MFRYFLTFLLINTCYQSLGIPIQPSDSNLSKSLATLATQCKNTILSKHLINQIKDCAVSSAPPYSKKQLQCLTFYDINMQLCSAVVSSKLIVNEDSFSKLEEKQDVNAVCTLAKDWVFTNYSDFATYKEAAEKFFRLPVTCGEVCGAEDFMTEANYYCKYYKTGLELLKSLPSTVNNAVPAPEISEPDFSSNADNPVPANSDPVKPEDTHTNTANGQIRQTDPAVAKTTTNKVENAVDDAAVKAETGAAQATAKQTPSEDTENADNPDEDVNVKRQENPVVAAPETAAPQGNKTMVVQAEKPVVSEEAAVGDLPVVAPISEQKQAAVIENPKPKVNDVEDYGDSDDGDDEPNEDEIKPEQEPVNQQPLAPKNIVLPVAHEAEASQKEFFPNSMPDGFSDDEDDHFFPFFMTSVILMVLLYVLYHNKSKVSKVFFGLILEGRQSGRRRNSRGHAYRRLDTLEQAMSANTAAPPSKIIY